MDKKKQKTNLSDKTGLFYFWFVVDIGKYWMVNYLEI